MNKRKIRKAKHGGLSVEKPTVRIGKKGATEPLVNEVSKQLEKRGVVKVKMLKTALINQEAKEIAQEVAEKTESRIVQSRGHTFTLYKPKKS